MCRGTCPFWWYLLITKSLKLDAVNHVQTSCVLSMFSALKYISKSRIHILSAVVAMVDYVSVQLLYYLSKCASWKNESLSSVLGTFHQFSSSVCSDIAVTELLYCLHVDLAVIFLISEILSSAQVYHMWRVPNCSFSVVYFLLCSLLSGSKCERFVLL